MKWFKNLDLGVSDDAEQDENIKFKIWNLSSASVSYMMFDAFVDSYDVTKVTKFFHNFQNPTVDANSTIPKTFDQTLLKSNISTEKCFLSVKMKCNIYHL